MVGILYYCIVVPIRGGCPNEEFVSIHSLPLHSRGIALVKWGVECAPSLRVSTPAGIYRSRCTKTQETFKNSNLFKNTWDRKKKFVGMKAPGRVHNPNIFIPCSLTLRDLRHHPSEAFIWNADPFWTVYFTLHCLILSRLDGRWGHTWHLPLPARWSPG